MFTQLLRAQMPDDPWADGAIFDDGDCFIAAVIDHEDNPGPMPVGVVEFHIHEVIFYTPTDKAAAYRYAQGRLTEITGIPNHHRRSRNGNRPGRPGVNGRTDMF